MDDKIKYYIDLTGEKLFKFEEITLKMYDAYIKEHQSKLYFSNDKYLAYQIENEGFVVKILIIEKFLFSQYKEYVDDFLNDETTEKKVRYVFFGSPLQEDYYADIDDYNYINIILTESGHEMSSVSDVYVLKNGCVIELDLSYSYKDMYSAKL
ncbi:MAG: hypothetical protein H7Y04_06130, partial [Verrucomicrobia bacterium]|nr:hypothetical protein [Cytophagales bacterium]